MTDCSRPASKIPCLAAAFATLLFLSGCGLLGGGLYYKLSPREGESAYNLEIETGRIERTPEGEDVEIPDPVVRSYVVYFEPTQRRGGKTWIKLHSEMVRGSRPASKSDLGSETLVIDRLGNFEDQYGIPLPVETELILPPLPKKIKKGQTWTAERNKKTGNTRQPQEWRFKYLGRGTGEKKRCRLISLSISQTEESDQEMPSGPEIHFKAEYNFDGEICFSAGKVRQADYLEVMSLTLSTAGPENIAMQKRDYTRYKIQWTGRTSRKK